MVVRVKPGLKMMIYGQLVIYYHVSESRPGLEASTGKARIDSRRANIDNERSPLTVSIIIHHFAAAVWLDLLCAS